MTMISVSNLRKQFDQFTVVDGISFSVKKGEVLGFLGPNGAGKSTTMKMITGFLAPTSGEVEVCGLKIDDDPLAIKKTIGYLPEGAPAYGDMTPLSFLHFIAEIRGYRGLEKTQKVELAIQKANLESVIHKPIENLSKGFKRRVGLAQAILHDPPVLIMDEPTDGLDPNQKHEVRELIAEMAKDKAIIVSTHILEEVHAICTRAIIIAQGKLLFDGTPDELESRSRYHNSIVAKFSTELSKDALDKVKALPGVAAVEKESLEGVEQYVVFAKADQAIAEPLAKLIKDEAWPMDEYFVQKGHLDEVFRRITTESTVVTRGALS